MDDHRPHTEKPQHSEKPQCDDAVHTLYHFLDGELTIQKRADIQRHLDECLPCLEAFDFEAELRTVISNKCRDQVPESLKMRIADAIQHEATHGTPPGGIATP